MGFPQTAQNVGGEIAGGWIAGSAAGAGGDTGLDAVHAEGPPCLAVAVPGDEVPAAAGVDQAVRLDRAGAGSSGVIAVAEAEGFLVATGAGDDGERPGVDRGAPGRRA